MEENCRASSKFFNLRQIKRDARVNTFKELKDKASNRSDWRVWVVKQKKSISST